MNRIRSRIPRVTLLLALLAATAARGGTPEAGSPADLQIRSARSRIASGDTSARSYNSLAAGLTRKARETGDSSFYDQALEVLAESERLHPADPDSIRTSAWVRMGLHEFAKAYRIARRHAARHPGDPLSLGVMGDALMELGRYGEAEKAYQAMVDLRPGPASYSRAAYLREMSGDLPGALELMRMALGATSLQETEDQAWLMVQVGHLQDTMGDSDSAEATYGRALALFPGYHYALSALAESALRSGRPGEALRFSREAVAVAPHAERYLLLADSLRALGREEEARAAEERFERQALVNSTKPDNENHDLVLFYLERRKAPAQALAIARREARVRQDVQTLDRLAWALYHDGKIRKAGRLMSRILKTGTRNPLILRHAEALRSPSPLEPRPAGE